MIVWLTGQPGSGKTTIAQLLDVDHIIDGDDLRELMPNPGYDEAGRRQNIDRAQTLAAFLARAGHTVAVALVAPYRDQRERFKASQPVLEVFLHTDEIRGREHFFADDYQPPETEFLSIDTGETTPDEAASTIHRQMAAIPQWP